MAVLNESDRFEVWRNLMTAAQELAANMTVTKADLRAAVDAVDSQLESNAATINGWFPLPARTSLTARQKAFIIGYIALRRALRS